MRASEVREALESAIQGITPDPPTYLKFSKLDAKGREVTAPVMERTFTVTLGQIPRRSAVGFESANWWKANFDMQLFTLPQMMSRTVLPVTLSALSRE